MKKLTIKDMQKLAKANNGKCLSKVYKTSRDKLEWKCDKGHTFLSTATNIKQGRWCPYCNRRKSKSKEDMVRIASERGGKFLSEEYSRITEKYKWECENKHVWEAKAANIVRGSWCPECYRHKIKKHRSRYDKGKLEFILEELSIDQLDSAMKKIKDIKKKKILNLKKRLKEIEDEKKSLLRELES